MNPWGALLGLVLCLLVEIAHERRQRSIEEDRPSSLRRALLALNGIHGKGDGGP